MSFYKNSDGVLDEIKETKNSCILATNSYDRIMNHT